MSLHATVPGEGPIPCDLLGIGEHPGVRELSIGRPFVGAAGGELDRFLNGYTCPFRDQFYLTNLIKWMPPKGKAWAPGPDDERRLWDEIAMVKPKVIVAFGQHVLRYFCGPDATLEAYHGIPHTVLARLDADRHPTGILGRDVWHGTVFPAYNPAAILHSPGLQAAFAYDMRRLGLFLKGKLDAPPRDEHEGQLTPARRLPLRLSCWPT